MNGYRKLDLHRWYDHTGTTILSRCSILTPLHSFDSLSSLFCIPFISAQGKGKGGTDDDAEARADGDADTIETTEEKGKSKKGSKETTDDIEAKTDVVEATEEVVSIKTCKGKHCKKNTTSVEKEKPCRGKSCDEDVLGDAEVRAEGAADDTPAEVKVKKCKKKKGCEVEDEEIATLAEEGVAEAVSVATGTEEPSKVSKVSKMSSDETEVRTIVWGLSSFAVLLRGEENFLFRYLTYFLSTHTNIFAHCAVSF